MNITLWQGDCRELIQRIPAGSVDAVVTDPPYPEIDLSYGRMTEADWHDMMDVVVRECRRILKPSGSAVFVLQANQERVGRTRPWLFEFMAKWAREWNMVQDVYWWNVSAPPTVHCHSDRGLTKPSVKPCVWLGGPDCFRDQDEVLIAISETTLSDSRRENDTLTYCPSGGSYRKGRSIRTCIERGGSAPFNLLDIANSDSSGSAAANGHGAGTPYDLCSWWIRYISPWGGVVCDPFLGSGTVGLAALDYGRSIIGIERDPGYFATASRRIAQNQARTPLFDLIDACPT